MLFSCLLFSFFYSPNLYLNIFIPHTFVKAIHKTPCVEIQFVHTKHGLKYLYLHPSAKRKKCPRLYSAKEAHALLASDTAMGSEEKEEYTPFLLFFSSSDEEPQQWCPRTSAEVTPQMSDPMWTPPNENYKPQISEFIGCSEIKSETPGFTEIYFCKCY